jgi:hypothetical protein
MADTKQILLTGVPYTAQVQTPVVVGTDPTSGINSSTANTTYTTQVTTPTLIGTDSTIQVTSNLPTELPVAGQVTDTAIEFIATNLGEDSVPDPRLFKFLSDEFGLSEQKLFDVFKNLSNLTTTEEQVRKLLQKVLADITTNSDVFNRVWTAFRTHTDSTANSELIQKDFEKVLADLANSSDLLSTDVGKYLTDVTALANLSYAVILVGKTLQDQTIGFSDVLTRIVDFNRNFSDTTFTTDDFFGEANIDDDQIAQVFKVVMDWISLPETFAVDVTKPDVLDQATASEQASLEPQLPKFDQFVSSDLQTSVVGLAKTEQTSNSEQQSFDVVKPDRTEEVVSSEQQAFDVIKPGLQDQFTNSDIVDNAVGKTRSDQFTAQNELYNFDIDKPDRTDQATTIEQVAKDVSVPGNVDQVSISELLLTKLIGININEIDYFLEDYIFDITDYTFKAVHARDQITELAVNKQFSELVDATDDFYGAANIDDDQVATFGKVVLERVNFAEAFERLVTYIRLFTDTAQMLEEVKLVIRPRFADQTSNSDSLTFRPNKRILDQALTGEIRIFDLDKTNVLDQATANEQAAFSTTKPRTDSVTNTDQFTRFYQAVRIFSELTQTTDRVEQLVERVSLEQIAFTELVEKVLQKLVLDQATTSEQQAFDFSAVYNELVDATDDFYGAANVDDDQIATFDKVLSDYATNSDVVITVADFNRAFLETAANTDLATLNFAKSVLETVTTSERFDVNFVTSRQDVVSVAETAAVDFSTSRTETVAQADLFTQSIEPNKYETVSTSENTNYSVGLEKSETVVTTETTTSDITTSKSEIASILENFVREWTAFRSFTETVVQTDQAVLATNKPVTETVVANEISTATVNKQQLETVVSVETTNKDVSTEFSELIDATDDFYGAANIDDDQVAAIDKLVSDHVTNSDVFERLVNYLRTFSELQSLSDFTTAVVDKTSLDTVVTAEQKQFNTSKPLQDSSTSTDTPRLSFSTDRADSLNNTTDNFSSQWNAVRVQAETVNTAELFKLNTDKSVTETANTAELLQKTTTTQHSEIVNTAETFVKDATVDIQELVDATDDFFGAANVDDDQTATVNKVVVDYATNSEVFERLVSYLRTFSELQSLSDFTTITTDKAVLETTNTAEQRIVNITNQRAEVVAATDVKEVAFSTSFNNNLTGTTDNVTTEFDANRTVTETVTKSDQTTLVTNKSVLETATTSETKTLDISKRQLDSAITAETVNKDTTTEFSDLVDATDDFYGAANLDDDQIATVNKNVADHVINSETITTLTDFKRSVNESQILSEVFAAVTNKALSDITNSSDTVTLLTAPNKRETVSTSQTISLTLQSYFSQDYVELGYTGETYTY